MAFNFDDAKKNKDKRRKLRIELIQLVELLDTGVFMHQGMTFRLDPSEMLSPQLIRLLINEDADGVAEALQRYAENDVEKLADLSAKLIQLIIRSHLDLDDYLKDWTPLAIPYGKLAHWFFPRTNN